MLHKTGNSFTKYTEFDELSPIVCRHARLAIADWPHIANSPLGIAELHRVRDSRGGS